jgi:hypothetical protein
MTGKCNRRLQDPIKIALLANHIKRIKRNDHTFENLLKMPIPGQSPNLFSESQNIRKKSIEIS